MKNKIKLIGTIALVAVIGFSMTSCATTTMAGAHTDHGLFSGFGVGSTLVQNDYQEIGSYMNILGLFDSGYQEYVAKVKAAEKTNKKVVVVTTNWFFILGEHTAYVPK
jgi:predicted small secreted protein